jgi:hypothetical protein
MANLHQELKNILEVVKAAPRAGREETGFLSPIKWIGLLKSSS